MQLCHRVLFNWGSGVCVCSMLKIFAKPIICGLICTSTGTIRLLAILNIYPTVLVGVLYELFPGISDVSRKGVLLVSRTKIVKKFFENQEIL